MAESRVALFLSVDILVTLLALAFVSLRIGYRWSKSKLAVSDYLISASMLTALIHMILDIIITASFGYARHQRDLPPELQGSYKTSLMFWLIQIFTKLPLLFSKLSLTFVYHDLIRFVDHPLVNFSRIVNYILMVVLTGFFTAATLVSMFACDPVYKSWLPKTPGHCIDTTVMFNYVTGAVNVSTSICLICVPLPVLYLVKNKRLEIKQLTALILFGLIDTVISIVRLYMITDLYDVKTDFTWLVIPTHIMIVVEFNVTIIAACVVVMRPCFQAMFDVVFPMSVHASHNASNRRKSNYRGGRSDGYIMSPDENDSAAQHDAGSGSGAGIVKTVHIELASNDASTEDILKDDGTTGFYATDLVMMGGKLEQWMDEKNLDGVVSPVAGNIGGPQYAEMNSIKIPVHGGLDRKLQHGNMKPPSRTASREGSRLVPDPYSARYEPESISTK